MSQEKVIFLVASGDLRPAANEMGWAAQQEMEQALALAVESLGWTLQRAHQYDPKKQHGFIDSQRMGIEVFKTINPNAPLIVAESIWQFSNHVLPGLITHEGPILTIANWSGEWPGLVGLLNLNGSLTKAGVKFSTLWSESFDDAFFSDGLQEWLETDTIAHDMSHVKSLDLVKIPGAEDKFGRDFAKKFKKEKAIMGVFDEGCMGMYNAIIPDDILHATGIYKERLSQSTLFARMGKVSDDDAEAVLTWLLDKGMKFTWGQDPVTELTRGQTLDQCKMYIAAVRMAGQYGCDTIGIQYQQGLMELTVASDLVEGLLNNQDRPPVYSEAGEELFAGEAIPHFNEVDECAGLDSLITYRLWRSLGLEGENTLHDIRWGETYEVDGEEKFVWVFLISGAAPPAHFIGGYKGATSDRQPAVYFKFGGGTLKGVSKPGNIVWSRVYVKNNQLHCDLGVGEVVALPEEETQRRWQKTTPEWPIMHGVIHGVTRDQLMARHQANHIHVVYTPDAAMAHKACRIKAATLAGLGIQVHFCGDVDWAGINS